jgi:hypothetical protein
MRGNADAYQNVHFYRLNYSAGRIPGLGESTTCVSLALRYDAKARRLRGEEPITMDAGNFRVHFLCFYAPLRMPRPIALISSGTHQFRTITGRSDADAVFGWSRPLKTTSTGRSK